MPRLSVEQEMPIPIIGGFGISRSPYINSQNLINMYISYNAASNKRFLSPSSGLGTPIFMPRGSNIRALYYAQTVANNLYVVSGNEIYSVDTSLTVNPVSSFPLSTAFGYVGVSNNLNQVIFVDGVNTYVWVPSTSTFTMVTTPFAVPLPMDVTFLDGYFIIASGFENNFYISALNDGTMWVPGNFSIFQSVPDTLVACRTFKRRLFLFGNISTEVWTDSGASDFPFRRDNTVLFEHGTQNPTTITQGFEKLVYFSKDKNGASSIMSNTGFEPVRISTPEVEYFIQNFTNVSSCDSFLYRENGDIFYQINFTVDDTTLLYNFTTNTWSQLMTEFGDRSLASYHAFFNNTHYVGAYNQGAIYPFSHNFLSNNGSVATRVIVTPPMRIPTKHNLRIDFIQLIMQVGVGTVTGNDTDPIVYLSLSRNGGITYGNRHHAEVGKIGEFTKRVIWRNLGTSRDFVLKFEFYHQVPFYVESATMYFEKMPT
jgi:hypothetical protein